MSNELYEPYSVDEYKGLKYGQTFIIDGKEHMIYRLDDKENRVTLLIPHSGFKYADIDDFLKLISM